LTIRYSHDVKTNCEVVQAQTLNQFLRRPKNVVPLSTIRQALQGTDFTGAAAYLNHSEFLTVTKHEIQLPPTTTPVAGQEF
jgi:hypothetical protein